MNKQRYEDDHDTASVYYPHYSQENGGLEARRRGHLPRNDQASSLKTVPLSSPTSSATFLFLEAPREDEPLSLFGSSSQDGKGCHDFLKKQDSAIFKSDSPSSSKPGAHMSHSFDAVSRKIGAYNDSQQHQLIEIAPGITQPLRGAQETWQCIQIDFYMPTKCICCGQDICCIMDSKYVLCPGCKVVSPMNVNNERSTGVGLGFTFDDLQKWQTEIILSRQR